MTLSDTLSQLNALGHATVRAQNAKSGAGENQSGVSLGDIRTQAKKIRTDKEALRQDWVTADDRVTADMSGLCPRPSPFERAVP